MSGASNARKTIELERLVQDLRRVIFFCEEGVNDGFSNAIRQMWERACSRKRCVSRHQCRLTHRFREQARSHRGIVVDWRSEAVLQVAAQLLEIRLQLLQLLNCLPAGAKDALRNVPSLVPQGTTLFGQ